MQYSMGKHLSHQISEFIVNFLLSFFHLMLGAFKIELQNFTSFWLTISSEQLLLADKHRFKYLVFRSNIYIMIAAIKS